jgi:hypothetical protein
MTDEEEKTLIEDVRSIKQCLLGYDGQGGLCKDHKELKKDYYNFKRWVIGIFCFLVGSGVIGIGAVQIAKFVGG